MKILAFDTSTAQGSVAVVESGSSRVLSERSWRREKSHSDFLTAEIESALLDAHLKIQEIDALAVGQGPGSFTGIRVAINAARSLAYALQKPVYVFETSETLVFPVNRTDLPILTVINAQKNSYFVSAFSHDGRRWQRQTEVELASFENVAARLTRPYLGLGDGCDDLLANLPAVDKLNLGRDSHALDVPVAASLALMAGSPFFARAPFVWNEVQPLYLRASGAEEKQREGSKSEADS